MRLDALKTVTSVLAGGRVPLDLVSRLTPINGSSCVRMFSVVVKVQQDLLRCIQKMVCPTDQDSQ